MDDKAVFEKDIKLNQLMARISELEMTVDQSNVEKFEIQKQLDFSIQKFIKLEHLVQKDVDYRYENGKSLLIRIITSQAFGIGSSSRAFGTQHGHSDARFIND